MIATLGNQSGPVRFGQSFVRFGHREDGSRRGAPGRLFRQCVFGLALTSLLVLTQTTAIAQNVTPAPAGGSNPVPANATAPAPLAAGAGGVDTSSYILGAQDVIGIYVFNHPELSRQHAIGPDGMISVPPLTGQLQAAGLTPVRLASQLKDALSETYVEPIVNIEVVQVMSKTFTLTGAVARTGKFPMPTPIPIFEAINYGGGFAPYANRKKIKVIREVNNQRSTLTFNYEDYVNGKNLDKNKNFMVQNGDTIYVTE